MQLDVHSTRHRTATHAVYLFFSSTDSSLHETKNKIFLSVLRVNVPYQRHIVIVIISSISSWLASDFRAVLSTWSLSSMIPFTAFYFNKSLFVTSRLSSKTKLSKCTQSRHVFGLLLLLYTVCIIHSFWTSLKPHFCRWTLLSMWRRYNKLRGRPPQYAPAPCKLTFDLLTLKVVSKSRVTWATSVPILVFLGLSVLDLGPMYATDRQTSDRRPTSNAHHCLMPPPYGAGA